MPIPLGILAVAGAGAGGGAFDLLETTVLSSAASSVTFSSLDSYSDYKHLQLRAIAKNDIANANLSNGLIQFNSDTGSNYTRHVLAADGSTVVSTALTPATNIAVLNWVAGASTANNFGLLITDIFDFSNTSKNKTIRTLAGGHDTSERAIGLYSGAWLNTNAITSILLTSGSGNFVTGSRFSLYGVK